MFAHHRRHMNHRIYLLLGSNLGDRAANLARARRHLQVTCGPILEASMLYATAAWGVTDQPDFLNQAILIESSLDPQALLQTVLRIEQEIGRVRLQKWGARTIDIDILFFDHLTVQTPELVIPHPELQNRRFALVPMSEISATFMHPVLNKTIQELLHLCPDSSAVAPYLL
jgi:2-amino-4-hydroxy-6-hydroxymethyldihydropteridine diphosphokinase